MSRICLDLYGRRPDFSEAKIGTADGKTYRIKERKRNTKKVKKKKNQLLYYFIVLPIKYFFTVITFRGKVY